MRAVGRARGTVASVDRGVAWRDRLVLSVTGPLARVRGCRESGRTERQQTISNRPDSECSTPARVTVRGDRTARPGKRVAGTVIGIREVRRNSEIRERIRSGAFVERGRRWEGGRRRPSAALGMYQPRA